MPVSFATDPGVKKRIEEAGYAHVQVWRYYAPGDTGEDAEVLFRGCKKGSRAMGTMRPFRAFLPDSKGGSVVVLESW